MGWITVVPRTPSAAENDADGHRTATGETAVRNYVCAVVGFVAAAAAVAAVYPVVPVAGRPYGPLATSALICLFVVGWLAVWTCVEAVWIRRAGPPERS